MFKHIIDSDLELRLPLAKYAEPLFALTESNRSYLSEWLPWLPYVKTVKDSEAFLKDNMLKFANGELLTALIFYQSELVGVCGYNSIDSVNRVGQIGYWLSKDSMGKGIMTRSVQALIEIGRIDYGLNRIEIRCATSNSKSRAIPERLGFFEEATLEKVEKVGDQYYDHVIYRLLGLSLD